MTIFPNIDELKGDLVPADECDTTYNVLGSPQRRVRGTAAIRNSQVSLFGKHPRLGHSKHEQILGLSPPRKRRAVSPVKTSGSPERRLRIRQLERGITPSLTKQQSGDVDNVEDYDNKSSNNVNASEFDKDTKNINVDRYIKAYLQNIEQRLDKIESTQLQILQQLEKLNNTDK